MPSEAAHSTNPPKGLPPVVPPTGRYIVQLFLVPGLIVAVATVLLLSFNWLFGDPGDPVKLMAKLDSRNADVRKRAANDLAQILLRDDRLASDPTFALDLATHLRQALKADTERNPSSVPASPGETTSLQDEGNFAAYLAACLGNCALPVGVPLLCEIATRDDPASPESGARRRRQAVWSLANLGENLKRFDRLAAARQAVVLTQLEEEAESGGERGTLARLALDVLRGRASKQPQAPGIDTALAKCAGDRDPFVRELVAFALNFWEGSAAENALMEATLLRLLHDDGHGGDEGSSRGGLTIRYNAVVALARRGSDKVPLGLLRDMLDEQAQLQLFRTKLKDGRDVPDEVAARTATVNALKAIAEVHRKRPQRDLSSLDEAIDALARHSSPVLKAEAQRTRLVLAQK